MTRTKRVSEKQLAANRANALQSTGPRTAEGRATSRWNALQHGVLARAVIPPALEQYESRHEFSFLLQTLHQELDPQSALEEMLVERIATSYWRLARLLRAEAGMIAERQERREQDVLRKQILSGVGSQSTKLSTAITALERVMDSPKRLRALLVEEDERWRNASDEDLRAAAEKRLASLRQQQESAQAQEVAIEQAQRSIPFLKDAISFARYEAALERQIYRALAALERLQRLRAGEPVPPPLSITVDGIPPDGAELS
jgi:hypothetical protein